MKLIPFILIPLITAYLVFSFVLMEFNPTEWTQDQRGWMIFVSIGFFFLEIIIISAIRDDYKDGY
jgi:hypothetical protein